MKKYNYKLYFLYERFLYKLSLILLKLLLYKFSFFLIFFTSSLYLFLIFNLVEPFFKGDIKSIGTYPHI